MISIDPGTGQNLGYAIWDFNGIIDKVGIISSIRGASLINRCEDISTKVDALVQRNIGFCRDLFCEWPSNFGGVSSSRDDILKLMFLVGMIGRICVNRNLAFNPVPVNDWKGQMSKEAVINRIERKLGTMACTGFKRDIWDAVGIGLYVQKRF